MAVYVGVPMWPYRNFIMCHMVADTRDELESMARRLGLKQEWVQIPAPDRRGFSSLVHYDISKSKRADAVRYGAIPLDDIHAEVEVLDRLASRPRKSTPKRA